MLDEMLDKWDRDNKVVRFSYIEITDKRHVTIAGSRKTGNYNRIRSFKTAEEARDYFTKFVAGAELAGYTVTNVDSNTVTFKWPES